MAKCIKFILKELVVHHVIKRSHINLNWGQSIFKLVYQLRCSPEEITCMSANLKKHLANVCVSVVLQLSIKRCGNVAQKCISFATASMMIMTANMTCARVCYKLNSVYP